MKEVIIIYWGDGLNTADIAQRLGIAESRIATALPAVLRRFRLKARFEFHEDILSPFLDKPRASA